MVWRFVRAGIARRADDLPCSEALYGLDVGEENELCLDEFADLLDERLPGLGLKTMLHELPKASHQAFLDLLASQGVHRVPVSRKDSLILPGHLLPHVLETFRAANVASISLSQTLKNEAGLILPAEHTLAGKPYSRARQSIIVHSSP